MHHQRSPSATTSLSILRDGERADWDDIEDMKLASSVAN